MARFLSIHWNPHSSAATTQAAAVRNRFAERFGSWRCVLETSGLCVFCASTVGPTDIHLLSNHSGLVIGTLFRRAKNLESHAAAPAPAVERFDRRELHRIRSTLGRSIVSDFWGSYVALLTDPEKQRSHVLRGPCSRVKCFHATEDHVHFFFSHVDDYADLRQSPLTINWDCIRAQAACSEYLGRETAIKEITTLEWGECAGVGDQGASRRFYWNPCEIAKTYQIATFDHAVSELHSAVHLCVQSWAAHYGSVVHRLSGGLDSSISATCARRHLPRSSMPCISYFTKDNTGDERPYARAVAEMIDVDLIESEREANVDLTIFRECAATAWPILDFSGYGRYRAEVEFVRRRSAKAIFCGELGDNLFENDAGIEAPADYVWRHGFRPGLLQVAIDNAIRRNFSVWKVLSQAVRDGLANATTHRWNSDYYVEHGLGLRVADHTLLREDTLESVRSFSTRFVHPWLEQIDGTPPAKFLMIYGMYRVSAYSPPFETHTDPPFVPTLASQPIAEVCLQTPTYYNNRGGVDRAVARSAFVGELPESVIRRTTKGGPGSWTRGVVRRNQAFFRSFLLDGILASQGILDPQRVNALISNEVGDSKAFVSDLIMLVYIEAWLRRRIERSRSLAA